MERVCWIPSIAPTKPSETGVLIGGRGNAIAVGAGSGMSIVPLLLGPTASPLEAFLSAGHRGTHPRDVDARVTELT